ncbi:asparaginase [Chelativorans sp. J32]|uniref:asparaginase n=1 Tax=Chelativorans sp. J32 TaxID=935840 RepID=UPI000480EB45|nr:asparaginase [Chelativorans sp. J32]
MGKPKIAIIVTGGTIDTLGEGRLDLFEYARHQRWLTPEGLVASIPELAEIADTTVVEMPRFGVASFSVSDWLALHDAITEAAREGADGVVVTQGTNYVEENAYFLSLALKQDVPVVLTAAMRPASGMGSDGFMNLVDAVRVASNPASQEHGVTVVINTQIHAAREVVKGHTHALEAFESPHTGPLGEVLPNGKVIYYRRGLKRHSHKTPFRLGEMSAGDWPRVDIILSYYGGDGSLVDAAVQLGARGLVSASFGAGRPGPGYNEAFDKAARNGIPVALAARGHGRVIAYPGLTERGMIAANELTPWKARILLQLAMTQTADIAAIQGMFDSF